MAKLITAKSTLEKKSRMCFHKSMSEKTSTFDEDAESGVLHTGQPHHEFIIRGKCHQISIFI